jgi:putative addiction module component (TIGR02574 family)
MNPTHSIQLDALSVAEKLALMERLWADLSRRPVDIPSPDWHGDVLAARLAAVQEGKTAFVDWEDAKRRLRDRLK